MTRLVSLPLRRRGAVTATLVAAFLTGCVDPLDVSGVSELVTESQQKSPTEDDRLGDKQPEYAPDRTVVEEIDGCQVTLNKSASVTRLTLQSSGALDESLRGKLFPTRVAALAALGGAPTLPSIEVVNGALKPFNDGLYAAVELAAESGDASLVNKEQLLLDLLTELLARSTGASVSERGPALTAARHIATALVVAGATEPLPASVAADAVEAATNFEQQSLYSKPIGFYTWTPELQKIFKRDRWLQRRYVPGVVPDVPFEALAELGLLAREPGPLSQAYQRSLDLYAGLTDPFFDRDPFSLSGLLPDGSALGDYAALEQQFVATLPADYPDAPFCNPGLAAFPASESAENRIMRRLLCGGELAEGETLLDGLIRTIQSGKLDLSPRPDSGFYDQQLYALETLLVPEKSSESQHLLLTRAYKQKLVETFKSLLIQTRETHVKQVAIVESRAASAELPPLEFTVYPKLLVEPFPTFYLRSARAYRFLEGLLNSVLGPEFLQTQARMNEDGTRANLSLGAEFSAKQQLLYGLHALSADSIGIAPELATDELSIFPLDEARAAARTWLASATSDPDVARDPRVSLPVALETDSATNLDYAIYWAVAGVKALHLQASYPESRRPEIVSATPYSCVQAGWKTFEPYLLVEQTIQVRRRADLPPLTREEFRALCDRYDTPEAIAEAFAAP